LFANTQPIDLSLAKVELFAGVENILDKAYRNHLATNRGLIRLEPGRNFFVKAKLSW
jgi:outer membrane receptor protein involved in Fe transport